MNPVRSLFVPWIELLSLFTRQHMVPLLLLSLKGVKDVYVNGARNWLVLGLLIFFLVALHMLSPSYVSVLTSFIVTTVLVVIARPSIDIKNGKYFMQRALLMILALLFFLLCFVLVNSHNMLKLWILRILLIDQQGLQGCVPNLVYGLSPVIIIFLLFLFDAQQGLKYWGQALWRAIKMIIYTYPLLVLLFFLIRYLLMGLCALAGETCALIVGLCLILPWLVSFLMQLYIKQVHEHFDWYYTRGAQ